MLAAAVPALACEQGHWVDRVDGDGAVVILEDGSVWAINAASQAVAAAWLPATVITVCDDRLVNTEAGRVAIAREVR